MERTKLYQITDTDFKAYSHTIQNGRVQTSPADNIPMMRWPDGRWCWLANVYMHELYQRGLSRKNNGGTLLTYAANISPLIRFCYNNQVDFIDLTDNKFTFFIKTLQGKRRIKDPEVLSRDANSVIAIGSTCLDFLACVGRFYDEDEFIGLKGRIIAHQKEYVIKGEGLKKGRVVRKYWHHRAFPTADPKKKRLPISTENIKKLREAVLPLSNDSYVRKRRYTMLTLLEITGARRYEVAKATVDSVRKAALMPQPMLKLITVKRHGGRDVTRFLPISNHDVRVLLEFIDKNRQIIIKKTCGFANDDGYLLVSETTGKGLKPNTITQEISLLRKEAGIKEKACPHMFRHRFITKMFVALIERHEFENVDDFRRALLDTETMKQQLQEWTGHVNISSLDVYLHLAFEEAAHYKKTYSAISAKRVVESLSSSLRQIKTELCAGITPTIEAALQIENFIDAALSDFASLSTSSPDYRRD